MCRIKFETLRIIYAMSLIATVLIILGCATEQFTRRYGGYTVVGKERKEGVQDVPVWILSCVRPNGAVRCQVKATGSYPDAGVNECTISCDVKHGDRWIKTQIGTQKETYFDYVLRLKSPSGEVVEDKVTSYIFNQVSEGQTIPKTESK